MPLDQRIAARVRAEAEKRGEDPDAAVAEAEKRMAPKPAPDGKGSKGGDSTTEGTGRPVAERLLVGFLPFIKVHELREHWLGLSDRIADDEMTCGEFAAKHGGGAASAPAAPEAE